MRELMAKIRPFLVCSQRERRAAVFARILFADARCSRAHTEHGTQGKDSQNRSVCALCCCVFVVCHPGLTEWRVSIVQCAPSLIEPVCVFFLEKL